MITEDEAKTKWCPLARAGDGDDCATNRDLIEDNPVYARCIGSACMAWRAVVQRTSRFDNDPPPSDPGWEKVGEPTDDSIRPEKWQRWERHVGYCGAFGRSE